MPARHTPAQAEALFWSKVNRDSPTRPNMDTPCWLWTGARNACGYGRTAVMGRTVLAHRAAYALVNGPIALGLCVCHACDTPHCVNPAHMWLGTHAENMDDMNKKGRLPSRAGERNGRAKLTAESVLAIRAAAAAGETNRAIALRFGAELPRVGRIVRRTTWAHLAPAT